MQDTETDTIRITEVKSISHSCLDRVHEEVKPLNCTTQNYFKSVLVSIDNLYTANRNRT